MSAVIRPLTEGDLAAARRICCTAFGTLLSAPEPENFWADSDYVYGRFGAEHVASFAVELDGELVGSNFATRCGSVGFFGPITMRPDRQGPGIANNSSKPSARKGRAPRRALHLPRTAPCIRRAIPSWPRLTGVRPRRLLFRQIWRSAVGTHGR